MKYLTLLLLLIPVALAAYFLHWPAWITFTASSLSILPLAFLMGRATEELAEHFGPQVGGFLNATLGNAAELIIAVFAIKEGLLELVKASITGSILGNILAVMGASLLLGGLSHGTLRFDRVKAGMRSSMLAITLVAIGIPSFFSHTVDEAHVMSVEYLSLGVAFVMVVLYFLWLVFLIPGENAELSERHSKGGPVLRPLVTLVITMVMLAFLSEILASSVEPVVKGLGVTEFFLGIFVIPLVGNVAEHLGGVTAALKGNMELSLAISLGSSLQIALLVAPLLVFISLGLGHPLTLVFNAFELIALGAAVLVASLISLDGESNWLEGAQLLAVYLILGLAFFLLPAS
ncbi:MAG: calcium/proton exchanger [Chloroflexi bacterium]|nr:MAG: calcium/proton exchanger [Chloroflexota bacterium]